MMAASRLADVARACRSPAPRCVLICTNTMHLIADEVQATISVPLINIIDETAKSMKAAGRKRPLLLATRYTMEHGFYSDRMKQPTASMSWCPMPSDRTTRPRHHLQRTLRRQGARQLARKADGGDIERAIDNGADSIILGCTEICLILDPDNLPLPGFDTTAIHARAAVDFALGEDEAAEEEAA